MQTGIGQHERASPGDRAVVAAGLVLIVVGATVQVSVGGLGPGEIGLALVAASALWRMARARRERMVIATVPGWCLAGFALASFMVAGASWEGGREVLQLWGFLVGGWLAGHRLRERDLERMFGIALSCGFALNLVVGLWQALAPEHIRAAAAVLRVLDGRVPSGRGVATQGISGLMRSELQFTLFICLAAPFANRWMLRRPSPWRWGAALLPVGCGVVVIPPQGLAVLAAVLIAGWHAHLSERGRGVGTAVTILVVSGLLLGACLRPGGERFESPWSYLTPVLVTENGRTAPKRLTVEVASAIKQAPRNLLGYGPGTYRKAIRKATAQSGFEKPRQNRVRPDGNPQLLITLVEYGLPAALVLLWLLLQAVTGAAAPLRGTFSVSVLPEDATWVSAVFAAGVGAGSMTAVWSVGLGGLVAVLVFGSLVGATPRSKRLRPRKAMLGWVAAATVGVLLGGIGGRLQGDVHSASSADRWSKETPSDMPPKPQDAARTWDMTETEEDRMVIEAEDAENVPDGWRLETVNDAGAHTVLSIPEGVGKGVGEAVYRFDSPEAGHYRLWLRVLWEDGCGNSVVARFPGQPPQIIEDGLLKRWHWVDAASGRLVQLPSGPASMTLINSEDGVHIDQIAFFKDARVVPSGVLEVQPQMGNTPKDAPGAPGNLDFDLEPMPDAQPFDKYSDEQ